MFTFALLAVLVAPTGLALPIVSPSSATVVARRGNDEPVTPLSATQVDDELLRPAQFARAAYCASIQVKDFSCGPACDALGGSGSGNATSGGVTIVQSGGGEYLDT